MDDLTAFLTARLDEAPPCGCSCGCPAPGKHDDDGAPGWCDSCRMNIHRPVNAVSDLIAFLNARYDEDEAAAKAADDGPWTSSGPYVDAPGAGIILQARHTEDAAHAARHDPGRVLREVEAKRAILASHVPVRHEGRMVCATCLGSCTFWPCPTLQQIAAVYSDHADYRPEWKP